MIETLADRYPDCFMRLDDGRLDLAIRRASAGSIPDREPTGRPENWWSVVPPVEPLRLDQLVAVAVEPGVTGNASTIHRVSATAMATGETIDIRVAPGAVTDGVSTTTQPLATAIDALNRFLSSARAVVAHQPAAWLPQLIGEAEQISVPVRLSVDVLDLSTLALLVDPTLDPGDLAAIAATLSIKPTGTESRTVADITAALLDRVGHDDRTWGLVQRCLHQAGDAWARLLPAMPLPTELGEVLVVRADPLASPGHGPAWSTSDAGLRDLFGALADGDPRFTTRDGQRVMAEAVARALDRGERLLVEAPTGVGKSLAYLVPAATCTARRGKAVVIATHTKVLQRQLRRDVERLRHIGRLRAPFRQIQGTSNYICPREIAGALVEEEMDAEGWLATAVAVRALATTEGGTWDEVADRSRQRRAFGYQRQRLRLRTTANACERRRCPFAKVCPLYTRLAGIDTDPGIVSTNHALIAAWSGLVAIGGRVPGDLMDRRRASFVFDEAHNLEDSLTQAWTSATGGIDLDVELARLWGRHGPLRTARIASRVAGIELRGAAEIDALRRASAQVLDELAERVRAYLFDYAGAERSVALQPGVVRQQNEFCEMASVAMRASQVIRQMVSRLDALAADLRAATTDDDRSRQLIRRACQLVEGASRDLTERYELLRAMHDLPDEHLYLHLLGVDDRGDELSSDQRDLARAWTFQRIPIEVGARFAEGIADRAGAVVLTSATLTVENSFEYLTGRLGIEATDQADPAGGAFRGLRVPSPFDHDRQGLLVLTRHLPAPTPAYEREFCEELAADQVGFLSLSGGRMLSLFTARRRMQDVAVRVREQEDALAERDVRLLVQGEDTPDAIAARFRREPGTVVYGVASYWEGFDAPGDTLSYLAIERPPYPHPADPLMQARQRAVSDRGKDPFLDYVVPRTAMKLAQGYGRLIRSEHDRGVVVLYDRRITNPTSANARLLSALPITNVIQTETRDAAWTAAIKHVTGQEPDVSQALVLRVDRVGELLDELQIEEGEDPVPKLRRAADELFGVRELRPAQIRLMRALLDGRDALGLLPTGSGKSLIFQLPALLHPTGKPFVVVSPLVALIKDQVDDLRSARGLRAVAGITGRTSATERTETLRDLAHKRVRLLYVSPERLVRDLTLREALARQPLAGLVVDEAHCVSLWGHDFRPEFRMIARSLSNFERSPRLALTATATREIEEDIVAQLGMEDPVTDRAPVDRANLRYTVYEVGNDRERTRELLRLALHQGGRPGIVYVSRRALADEIAWILREAGYSSRSYHAGMLPEQREAVQDDFLSGNTQIIVATKAFGMGINKADIAWVAHYDLPESVESYAQEAGRAARTPELVGECVLFYHGGDVGSRRRLVSRPDQVDDVEVARRVLAAIAEAPLRAGDHVFDGQGLADTLGIELDELNVIVSRLEDVGNVNRKLDCSARGMLSVGIAEPSEEEARRRFIELMRLRLRTKYGVDKQLDFNEVEARFGVHPDELERLLIDWTFDGLVSFRTTQRLWRVHLGDPSLRATAYDRAARSWRNAQRARLESMITYVEARRCRRVLIAEAFGDDPVPCTQHDGVTACDVCCADAAPTWHAVPISRVPDPEELVGVELIVLKAVRWASAFADGRYGEGGLKAALLGQTSLGEGRPLGRGLMGCPQFGALAFLRSGRRRLDRAVSTLIDKGQITREEVANGRVAAPYCSLLLTEAGRRTLEVGS